jgi:hypothetical protein
MTWNDESRCVVGSHDFDLLYVVIEIISVTNKSIEVTDLKTGDTTPMG